MKRLSLLLFGALVAVMMPLGAQPAQAQSPPDWSIGTWVTSGGTAATETITGPAVLQITDYQCVGDRFTVLVDGVAVGNTSDVPMPDACAGADVDEACALGTFSSGSFAIPDGDHMVEIRHLSGFESGAVAYRLGPIGCNDIVAGDRPFLGQTALCIENDLVQANAQGQRVGNVFTGPPDRILIATGAPSCSYNCLDGFDVNCDGKIGDFCPVELDREAVADVQPCLDALNPAPPEEQSVPVEPVAIVIGSGSLAHTGADTDALAHLGTALLGAGAVALGAARRGRERRRTLDLDRWLHD